MHRGARREMPRPMRTRIARGTSPPRNPFPAEPAFHPAAPAPAAAPTDEQRRVAYWARRAAVRALALMVYSKICRMRDDGALVVQRDLAERFIAGGGVVEHRIAGITTLRRIALLSDEDVDAHTAALVFMLDTALRFHTALADSWFVAFGDTARALFALDIPVAMGLCDLLVVVARLRGAAAKCQLVLDRMSAYDVGRTFASFVPADPFVAACIDPPDGDVVAAALPSLCAVLIENPISLNDALRADDGVWAVYLARGPRHLVTQR
jgi:hypothetical protein